MTRRSPQMLTRLLQQKSVVEFEDLRQGVRPAVDDREGCSLKSGFPRSLWRKAENLTFH